MLIKEEMAVSEPVMAKFSAFAVFIFVIQLVCGKIYERCELARELRDVHEIPDDQLATWVCIAKHESQFDTKARNHGSGDHGIFQISQLYWCSPPGEGYACGIPCSDLWDDDIEDDVICARRIYREHKRLSGDGFNAWVVYNLYCNDKRNVQRYIDGCFEDENEVKTNYIEESVARTTTPRASRRKLKTINAIDRSSGKYKERLSEIVKTFAKFKDDNKFVSAVEQEDANKFLDTVKLFGSIKTSTNLHKSNRNNKFQNTLNLFKSINSDLDHTSRESNVNPGFKTKPESSKKKAHLADRFSNTLNLFKSIGTQNLNFPSIATPPTTKSTPLGIQKENNLSNKFFNTVNLFKTINSELDSPFSSTEKIPTTTYSTTFRHITPTIPPNLKSISTLKFQEPAFKITSVPFPSNNKFETTTPRTNIQFEYTSRSTTKPFTFTTFNTNTLKPSIKKQSLDFSSLTTNKPSTILSKTAQPIYGFTASKKPFFNNDIITHKPFVQSITQKSSPIILTTRKQLIIEPQTINSFDSGKSVFNIPTTTQKPSTLRTTQRPFRIESNGIISTTKKPFITTAQTIKPFYRFSTTAKSILNNPIVTNTQGRTQKQSEKELKEITKKPSIVATQTFKPYQFLTPEQPIFSNQVTTQKPFTQKTTERPFKIEVKEISKKPSIITSQTLKPSYQFTTSKKPIFDHQITTQKPFIQKTTQKPLTVEHNEILNKPSILASQTLKPSYQFITPKQYIFSNQISTQKPFAQKTNQRPFTIDVKESSKKPSIITSQTLRPSYQFTTSKKPIFSHQITTQKPFIQKTTQKPITIERNEILNKPSILASQTLKPSYQFTTTKKPVFGNQITTQKPFIQQRTQFTTKSNETKLTTKKLPQTLKPAYTFTSTIKTKFGNEITTAKPLVQKITQNPFRIQTFKTTSTTKKPFITTSQFYTIKPLFSNQITTKKPFEQKTTQREFTTQNFKTKSTTPNAFFSPSTTIRPLFTFGTFTTTKNNKISIRSSNYETTKSTYYSTQKPFTTSTRKIESSTYKLPSSAPTITVPTIPPSAFQKTVNFTIGKNNYMFSRKSNGFSFRLIKTV